MTRPDLNGPEDYENPEYNFTANLTNPATGGLGQFSQMTKADWEAFEGGRWNERTKTIGDGVDLLRVITNALVLFAKGDITGLVELFGNTIVELITSSSIYQVITGAAGGLTGLLADAAGLIGLRWNQVDQHEVDISAAATAAEEANLRVDALITGGVRTLYTSSTTWTKPANAVKIGVICIGAGGGGQNAVRIGEGNRAFGGGYVYCEFPADAVPDTVAITVPPGHPANILGPGIASFGSLLSSPTNGAGYKLESSGRSEVLNAPAHPGALAEEPGPNAPGGALGGASGGGTGNPGGAGENGQTTGLDITGGAGGGGGDSTNPGVFGGATSVGGPAGFPGGPGGAGGTTTGIGAAKEGGAGGGAIVAVIVW